MEHVKGITGYPAFARQFIEATEAIDFFDLHQPFIQLIPERPGRVLDVGAGIGRDAAVLAELGHTVVAVEPTAELREAARKRHGSPRIEWVDDSLPLLTELGDNAEFDFILASAVWHHLDQAEQRSAMRRISTLLRPGGVFALSLRHGPAGIGTHVFPTDRNQAIGNAQSHELKMLVHLPDQPSLVPGKKGVTWTKLAFSRNQ